MDELDKKLLKRVYEPWLVHRLAIVLSGIKLRHVIELVGTNAIRKYVRLSKRTAIIADSYSINPGYSVSSQNPTKSPMPHWPRNPRKRCSNQTVRDRMFGKELKCLLMRDGYSPKSRWWNPWFWLLFYRFLIFLAIANLAHFTRFGRLKGYYYVGFILPIDPIRLTYYL